ncbi:phasin family protein [Variovorax sp. J31P207]|uniref:phasin family protein n=1 Tax=Variovorax sp. J31P207 TaxID=3053510 RepID=UPI0025789F07|nr:phasin family protein [Variovorax sp. J31P207]MDM0066265.1 phasin family protein [Variovorax sp. J31P207]
MATRKDSALPKKPAPARKPAAPRRKASAAAPPTETTGKPAGAEGLLRAGLKALGNVGTDVVKRHTHVIEGLLGIQKTDAGGARPAAGFPGLDSFGIRKFEDVFDQRVASALQRLGMPSAEELQALRDEVRQLREQLDAAKPATRRKR